MDKVGEDSSLVPDPNPLWAQYHHVNKQVNPGPDIRFLLVQGWGLGSGFCIPR